jgi:hypothetical protein
MKTSKRLDSDASGTRTQLRLPVHIFRAQVKTLRPNWKANILWALTNFTLGFIVKFSGLGRPELLLGQFAGTFLLIVAFTLIKGRMSVFISDLPRDRTSWEWMGLRIVIGLLTTVLAFEGYALCFGYSPVLFSLSAIWLPLLGFFIPSLLEGKRKSVLAATAGLCLLGIVIGSSNVGASCNPMGAVYGFLGGLTGSSLALIQKKLKFQVVSIGERQVQVGFTPSAAGAIYCGVAALLVGCYEIVWSGGIPASTFSLWCGLMALAYWGVQIFSQEANEVDPVSAGLTGLTQIPASTGAAQLLGEPQPPQVWFASVAIVSGLALFRAKGNRG